jgi:hypothetical protein
MPGRDRFARVLGTLGAEARSVLSYSAAPAAASASSPATYPRLERLGGARSRRRPASRTTPTRTHTLMPEGKGQSEPVGDPPAREVIGGEFNLDAITGREADSVAAHPAGHIRERLVTVVERDFVHAVSERFEHFPCELDLLLLDDDG